MSEKLIIGYEVASNLTGIPVWRLQDLVQRRMIRVIRLSRRSAAFYPSELLSDIRVLQVEKLTKG